MHDPLTAWWSTISLRTKITGVTVLLVTLGLLVAGVGTMTVLRNYLVEDVDTRIKMYASELTAQGLLTTECSIEGPNDYFVAVADDSGDVICHNSQDNPPKLSTMTSSDMSSVDQKVPFTLSNEQRSTQWRLVAVPAFIPESGEDAALVVGQNLDQTNEIITRYALTFLGFGVSVLVLGAALTRLLVTSTFAPLRQVEATAAAIADGNFSERLPGATTPNTEVGRLNRSLNTMLSRIDRAFGDRAKTIDQMRRFVGDASHELRTPLVSVRGYAELYRMGALNTPDEVGQAMERIEKEAIRMGVLVEDLLELARLDEAKPLQLKPVDLVPIAYDAASDAMASAPDREVDVIFNEPVSDPDTQELDVVDTPELAAGRTGTATRPMTFAGAQLARLRTRRSRTSTMTDTVDAAPERRTLDTPAIVLADENKIRQVVTNLIGNAMRFTNAGTPIEIGVGVDHARHVATIDVVDHGDGIPPQIRDKIFQRFWRADTSRTRETGGSGLGLAIVAGIVIAHHGSVEVLQTEGGGATFRVVLPLLPEGWTPPKSPTDA